MGGRGGGWGEAAGFGDQAGARQEPCLLPDHDEKALQLPQVSGEAEHTRLKGDESEMWPKAPVTAEPMWDGAQGGLGAALSS